jgi:hypothetical protein
MAGVLRMLQIWPICRKVESYLMLLKHRSNPHQIFPALYRSFWSKIIDQFPLFWTLVWLSYLKVSFLYINHDKYCSDKKSSSDEKRIKKSLKTGHPAGLRPLLRGLNTEHDEAAFISGEIKRMIAHSGGALHWGDFAVLRKPLASTSKKQK